MSMDRTETMLRLAGMVTDGTEVDWAAEKMGSAELALELAELATLEKIRLVATEETSNGPPSIPPTGTRPPLFHWGRLAVLEALGEGSFGEVYRAFDPDLRRDVALKLRKGDAAADDAGTERFLSEARRLARLRHPNVLVIYGVEVHGGRAGFWTEFLRGATLEALLRQKGIWDPREAAIVGIDICRALSAAHASRIIHRDVKTTNVMREEGGRVVLMDFGSGGNLPQAGDVHTSVHIQGTPIAMAPEQLRGVVAGPATDIYGLGVLLFRLVTKSFPVEGRTIAELLDRHEKKERKHLRDIRPDLPTEFVQVVERALEARPEDRFQSAGEMELALAGTVPSNQKRAWAGKPQQILAASVAVAVLIWGLWLAGKRPQPTPVLTALAATASLYRHTDTGDERLFPGAKIAVGDHLFMKLSGSDSMFVYVVDEDDAGTIFVLFPNPSLSPTNPLAPSLDHRLPERMGGKIADWIVTSSGGKETITVIANRRSVPELEHEIDRLPKASADRPIQYADVKPSAFRGIGGIEIESSPATGYVPRSVSDALRKLAEKHRGVDEPWIWQEELEAPAVPSP